MVKPDLRDELKTTCPNRHCERRVYTREITLPFFPWKQWHRARKRIGELIKLGAFKRQAILTGLSRKGYWHLAKTLSMNVGLSNAHISRSKGLRRPENCGSRFTIRPRPDDFREPPGADPHARWCGEGRLKTVPYPIMPWFLYSSFLWRSGIPRPLHIFLASLSGISVCRGTVSTEPLAGFIQSE
jgi:hypothetical protein